MHTEEAWAVAAGERRALADLLETLDDQQWQHPSLCASWTVADVATHMMVGPTESLRSFAAAMVRARGRFHRANRLLVQHKAHRPTTAIVHDLRTHAESRFTPPGAGWTAPLADLLLHRLDICLPLGIDHGRPVEPWRPVLDFLLTPAARRAFTGRGRPELTYLATDLGWSGGTGPRVEAPAESLALALTRRPTDRLDDLSGPGAEPLRRWARCDPA